MVKVEGDGNNLEIVFANMAEYDMDGNILKEPTIEDKWKVIREMRDELLQATDWVVIKSSESGNEVPTKYIEYRTKLRDIPSDFDKPEDVVFPGIN